MLVRARGRRRAAAGALAAASGGSVARALAEQAGDLGDDRDAALGVLRGGRPRSVGRCAEGVGARSRSTDSDRRDREALAARLDRLRRCCATWARWRARRPDVLANGDLADDLRRPRAAFDLPRVTAAMRALARAESALERNASPKIVADWVALHL